MNITHDYLALSYRGAVAWKPPSTCTLLLLAVMLLSSLWTLVLSIVCSLLYRAPLHERLRVLAQDLVDIHGDDGLTQLLCSFKHACLSCSMFIGCYTYVIYIYIYIYIYTHTHTYIHVCICICICIYIYIYTYVYIYIYICICTYGCVYVVLCVLLSCFVCFVAHGWAQLLGQTPTTTNNNNTSNTSNTNSTI